MKYNPSYGNSSEFKYTPSVSKAVKPGYTQKKSVTIRGQVTPFNNTNLSPADKEKLKKYRRRGGGFFR